MNIFSLDHFELVELIFECIPHFRDRLSAGLLCNDMHDVFLEFNRKYMSKIERNDECLMKAARDGDPIITQTNIDFSSPERIGLFSEICSSGNIKLFMHLDRMCKETEDKLSEGNYLQRKRRSCIIRDIFRYNLENSKNGNCIRHEYIDTFTMELWKRVKEEDCYAMRTLKILSPFITVYGKNTKLYCEFKETNLTFNNVEENDHIDLLITQEYFYSGNYKDGLKQHIGNQLLLPIIEKAMISPVTNKDTYEKNLYAALKFAEDIRKTRRNYSDTLWVEILLIYALERNDESVNVVLSYIKSSSVFEHCINRINYKNVWLRAEKHSKRNIDKYIDMWNLDIKKV